jgi:hypothetical protein
MALSGSTDWSLNAEGICKRAIGKCVRGEPTSLQKAEALEGLNIIVKALQNDNIFLWSVDWTTKTFSAPDEVIGDNDGLNYTCRRGNTGAASNRPNSGADYTTYWEQTGSAGVTWVLGTDYSAIGDFAPSVDTLDVIQAYIRRNTSDDPVVIIDRESFHARFDKDNTGQPIQLYLEKKLVPRIYLWPQPENTTDVLHYLRVKKLQDFDRLTNDPDFTTSMLRYLIYELASDLADDYGLELNERVLLTQKAAKFKRDIRKGNRERPTRNFVGSCYSNRSTN